jgi:hypothetical protein
MFNTFFLKKRNHFLLYNTKHFKLVIPSWQLEKAHFTLLVKVDVLFFLSNYAIFKYGICDILVVLVLPPTLSTPKKKESGHLARPREKQLNSHEGTGYFSHEDRLKIQKPISGNNKS